MEDILARKHCGGCGDDVTALHFADHMAVHNGPDVNGEPIRNGSGIDRRKLTQSTGRPKGARNLNAKHPSSIARAFKKAGLNWQEAFALAIKAASNYALPSAARRQAREDIKMWLKLLPYLVTTTNRLKVRKWKGKASKAALVALNALEGK